MFIQNSCKHRIADYCTTFTILKVCLIVDSHLFPSSQSLEHSDHSDHFVRPDDPDHPDHLDHRDHHQLHIPPPPYLDFWWWILNIGHSASTFRFPSWSSVSASLKKTLMENISILPVPAALLQNTHLILPSSSSRVGSISSQPSGGGFLFCRRTWTHQLFEGFIYFHKLKFEPHLM